MWNEIMLFAPNATAVETLRAWLRSRNGLDVEHSGVHVETDAGPVEMVFSDFWSSYEDWEQQQIKKISPHAVPVLFLYFDDAVARQFLSQLPRADDYLVDDDEGNELSVVPLPSYLAAA